MAVAVSASVLTDLLSAATYKHNKSVSTLALTTTTITATAAFLAVDATAATYKHNKSVSTLALTATAITATAADVVTSTTCTHRTNHSHVQKQCNKSGNEV